MVEYPKTVMSDYRVIAVDISFELIPIVFRWLDAHKPRRISSDELSRMLVGQTHRNDGVRLNRAYKIIIILITSVFQLA